MAMKSNGVSNRFAIICLVAAVAVLWAWSPFDYVLEAGNSAYYQARLAYIRGGEADKQAIKAAFSDKKITLREYSDVVFPLYLRGVNAPENLFPAQEQQKSKEQLRNDLAIVLQ